MGYVRSSASFEEAFSIVADTVFVRDRPYLVNGLQPNAAAFDTREEL